MFASLISLPKWLFMLMRNWYISILNFLLPISDDSLEDGGLNDELEVKMFSTLIGWFCNWVVSIFVESSDSSSDKMISVVFAIKESSSMGLGEAMKFWVDDWYWFGASIAFLTNWSLTCRT